MRTSDRTFIVVALLGLLLAACIPTTSLRSAWYDSSFKGAPMTRILVVGVASNLTDRRVFEDLFAKAFEHRRIRGKDPERSVRASRFECSKPGSLPGLALPND